MSTTADVLNGYASLIATAGIGVYDPATAYAPTDTAVFIKNMPDGDYVPDRCIVLDLLTATDETVDPVSRVLLNVACRGTRGVPLDPDDLADQVFNLLQNRMGDVLGNTTVMQCLRRGSVPTGQDSQSRWTRVDHYYLDLAVQPTTQRPAGGWD